MAVGTALPTSEPTASKGEATYRKHGNHYQVARRTEVGMDTRNEMCKANNEERTTGYAN
jgi:hypothetical protein